MSTDRVNASPTDVRRLAQALTAYREEVLNASKRVRGALQSASWSDHNKEQFEANFQDVQKRLDRFMSGDVGQMVKALNDLARRLDDVRDVRM